MTDFLPFVKQVEPYHYCVVKFHHVWADDRCEYCDIARSAAPDPENDGCAAHAAEAWEHRHEWGDFPDDEDAV